MLTSLIVFSIVKQVKAIPWGQDSSFYSTQLFLKWAYLGLFFSIFYFSMLYNWQISFCRCWDSNRRSLVSEATTLPTVPQPLPNNTHLKCNAKNTKGKRNTICNLKLAKQVSSKSYICWIRQSLILAGKLFLFHPEAQNSIIGLTWIPSFAAALWRT